MKNKQSSDDRISEIFAGVEHINPNQDAKQRAINLANQAFLKAQPKRKTTRIRTVAKTKENSANQKKFSIPGQGSEQTRRPMGTFVLTKIHTLRNTIMQTFVRPENNRLLYGALGTSFVAVFGVLIAFNTLQTDFSERTSEVGSIASPVESVSTASNSPHTRSQPSTTHELTQSANELSKGELDQALYDNSNNLERTEEITLAAAPPATFKIKKQSSIASENIRGLVAGQGSQISDSIPNTPKEYRDQFEKFEVNTVKRVAEHPVSTFSIDVDTASYSFVRRQLNTGVLPNKNAVRTEELINYFDYAYPSPKDRTAPFNTMVSVLDSPWKKGNKLVHVGLKGYTIAANEKPKSNLVFLLDVSGSMHSTDKLPLVKQSMNLLLNQLHPEDTIAIAVYAGAAGTVLEPTPAKEKQKILNAMNRLQAGGSTAGAQGIKLAYELAENHFDKNAVNRIILATDGDFNVGISDSNQLKQFVERKREKGIFLSVLGFGQGNYNDQLMQNLAQNGNGIAAYIDTLSEAQKVLVNEAHSTLFSIAKDVKIQVEFNPSTVAEYRLIGYETRSLNREDFNNDKVDAGEIGAGHTVTAIYEITPTNSPSKLIDNSRYSNSASNNPSAAASDDSQEYGFIKLRYKLPNENESKLLSQPIMSDTANHSSELQREIDFSIAVAGFSQLLKGGKFITHDWSYDQAIKLAQENKGDDLFGYRTEFVQLIRKAKIAAAME